MKTLFESFFEMANRLPIKAIRKALEQESRMIETDLMHGRIMSRTDGYSIMIFHRFVESCAAHHKLLSVVLPIEHVLGYQRLVNKMVAAEELPYSALDEFDETFAGGVKEPVAA